MVKFNLPVWLAVRIDAKASTLVTVRAKSPRPSRPTMTSPASAAAAPSGEPALPPGFETEAEAEAENRTRVAGLRLARPAPGWTSWTNIGSRLRLLQQLPFPVAFPPRDAEGYDLLLQKLEYQSSGTAVMTTSLASAVTMRAVRRSVISTMIEAFETFPDEELATATVINRRWTYTAGTLDAVTAKLLKNRFRAELNRIGLIQMPGPFIAILHGEFEPRSGTYVLHFHILTTRAKAQALHGLKRFSGYRATASGAAPIVVKPVRDREKQFSYLLKGFWPARTIRTIGGIARRERRVHRIPEPFASQVLLWLDRQRLRDLTIMNGCWSNRNGGPAPMKDLYLSVMGPW